MKSKKGFKKVPYKVEKGEEYYLNKKGTKFVNGGTGYTGKVDKNANPNNFNVTYEEDGITKTTNYSLANQQFNYQW